MTTGRDWDTQRTLRLQKAAIESAANAIFITNRSGTIEWANRAFEVLTGYRLVEAIGANPRILKSDEQDEQFFRDMWQTILNGDVWQGRVTNRRKSGELYTAEQTITPIRDDGGVVTHFVAIHEDITARLASEERIAHMALHDYLTDLPNRYALDNRLELELTRARRSGSRFAVLWIDLDNFKDVNDTFGHVVGDQLLIAVSQRLKLTLRDVDSICRLGGDEFAIVQPDIASRKNAAQLAERLLRAFAESFKVGSQEIFTSASIGISVSDRDTTSKSEFMKQGDLALYRAKSEGRNTYRFFETEMDAEIRRRMKLAQDLHRAVRRGELYLEYRPQVGLGDQRIVGAEALLCWRHPKIGIVAAGELVTLAESTGLMEEVGEWLLQAACRQAKRWQDSGLPAIRVAVGLSAAQLRNPHFVDKVASILADTELEARYLELELTEAALMEGREIVEKALQALHELGIRISIAGFGRGFASLDYLRRNPLSKVKIDESFVRDMDSNYKNAAIVGAVIDLAAKLDLQVIAEGAKPADLLQRVVENGLKNVEIFYLGQPVPSAAFEDRLTVSSDRIKAHRR